MTHRFPRPLTLATALTLLTGFAAVTPVHAQDADPKEAPPVVAKPDAPKPDAPKAEPPIPAQPPAPQIDADAKKALDAMVDAYAALKSFSTRLTFTSKEGEKPQTVTSEIFFSRPNLVKVTGKQSETNVERTVISDGKSSFATVSSDALAYVKSPALPDDRNIGRALQLTNGGGTGLMPVVLLGMKPEQAKKQILGQNVIKAYALPDDTADGVPVRQIRAEFSKPRPYSITFVFGKDDNLLRRLTIDAGGTEAPLSLTEEYTEVKANPDLPADTFAFKPAPGAKEKVEKVTNQFYDPRIKVGASPLPIAGKDLKGTPVSLAAYKGKVVLVDFWATWCGPCVAEIPNVVAVYNKYKGKGFDVLGVSLDDANVAKKVTDFAAENKMPWKQIYDGKGWRNAVATTYGVRAIPFTMLIGRDGKIAAVGARGPALETAVKKALAQQ